MRLASNGPSTITINTPTTTTPPNMAIVRQSAPSSAVATPPTVPATLVIQPQKPVPFFTVSSTSFGTSVTTSGTLDFFGVIVGATTGASGTGESSISGTRESSNAFRSSFETSTRTALDQSGVRSGFTRRYSTTVPSPDQTPSKNNAHSSSRRSRRLAGFTHCINAFRAFAISPFL